MGRQLKDISRPRTYLPIKKLALKRSELHPVVAVFLVERRNKMKPERLPLTFAPASGSGATSVTMLRGEQVISCKNCVIPVERGAMLAGVKGPVPVYFLPGYR